MKILIFFLHFICISLGQLVDYISETPCGYKDIIKTDACNIARYPNDKQQCYDRQIQEQDNKIDLGNVNLRAYVGDFDIRTKFCVSFNNIQWKDLKLRFRKQTGRRLSVCRDLNMVKDVPSEKNLYYNCTWTSTNDEGDIGNFDYEYKSGDQISTKNFTFYIPNRNHLQTFLPSMPPELFLYVDVTNLLSLKLYIQLPPNNMLHYWNITDYDIYVFQTRNGETTKVDDRSVSNDMAVNGYIKFTYPVLENGIYFFNVTPYNRDDYGIDFPSSTTPQIYIPKSKTTLVVCIVGVSALIPVFMILLFILRKQCKNPRWSKSKILFIYKPTTPAYVNLIGHFATELKEKLGLDVMIDVNGIPKSASKDPFTWLSSAFYQATHVVFFISPKRETNNGHVYQNLFEAGLKFTSSECTKKTSIKKFLVVSFAFSNDELPKELLNFKRYKLAEDTNRIVKKLQNNKTLVQCNKLEESLRSFIDAVDREDHQSEVQLVRLTITSEVVPLQPEETALLQPEEVTLNSRTNNESEKIKPFQYQRNELNFLGPQYEIEQKLETDSEEDYETCVHDLVL